MKTNLLLLTLFGIALIIIGTLLIMGDKGSCPIQPSNTPNPGGAICYHTFLSFFPATPIGMALVFVGAILLIMVFVRSRTGIK